MASHRVTLLPDGKTVEVPTGSLVVEATRLAGIKVPQPCGGQGRCGRCSVQLDGGGFRRRSARACPAPTSTPGTHWRARPSSKATCA
ncbi:MAG: 2Fe-2S ferredoxin-type protein [Anaerolineales bacterium]|nr:2Fe-2S ferredoxin-type protein [Anaerolineales bacterium]